MAQGWQKRWAAFERGAQPLSDRMMELAHVEPGQKVLDVATGIGEPAMTAALRVGQRGSVVAVDQAPQMLAVARERMEAAGIQTVEFVEGDAEAVPLPPDSFDAVVCRWGIVFFHDVVGALARFRSSLVPGGWLVAAKWRRTAAGADDLLAVLGAQPQAGAAAPAAQRPKPLRSV